MISEHDVKTANRQFYDMVSDRYEEIDGRRSFALELWLRKNLSDLRRNAPGGCLLDIGAGSGLVTRCAEGIFTLRIGLDVSPKILAAHRQNFDAGVNADVDWLPFADNSFDIVTCFAVLHHLYAFEGLVSELARVLRPGGVFYSDHDMEAAFSRRFHLPLSLYRRIHNAQSRYVQINKALTPELYELTEWQENGVDGKQLAALFEQAGFRVTTTFHWFGLLPVLDKLFGVSSRKRGWAPLLSIVAVAGGRT